MPNMQMDGVLSLLRLMCLVFAVWYAIPTANALFHIWIGG